MKNQNKKMKIHKKNISGSISYDNENGYSQNMFGNLKIKINPETLKPSKEIPNDNTMAQKINNNIIPTLDNTLQYMFGNLKIKIDPETLKPSKINNNSVFCISRTVNIEKINFPEILIKNMILEYFDIETIKKLYLISKIFHVIGNNKKKKNLEYYCRKGNLQLVKFIYKFDDIKKNTNFNSAFFWSCIGGNIMITKWLCKSGLFNLNPETNFILIRDSFMEACANDNILIAQMLYKIIKNRCISDGKIKSDNNNENSKEDIKMLNFFLCKVYHYNNIKVAKWLYTIYDTEYIFMEYIKIHYSGHIFIEYKKKYPDLENCEHLKIYFSEYISTEYKKKFTNLFIENCEQGNFEIVEFLYEKYKSFIDININYNYIFYICCIYGHLEIAKWLYNIENMKNNIKDIISKAFFKAYENNQILVVKWLYSIDNKIKIKDNKILAILN